MYDYPCRWNKQLLFQIMDYKIKLCNVWFVGEKSILSNYICTFFSFLHFETYIKIEYDV